jgi:hypothetical protein
MHLEVNKEIFLIPEHEFIKEPNFSLNFEERVSTKLYAHIKVNSCLKVIMLCLYWKEEKAYCSLWIKRLYVIRHKSASNSY